MINWITTLFLSAYIFYLQVQKFASFPLRKWQMVWKKQKKNKRFFRFLFFAILNKKVAPTITCWLYLRQHQSQRLWLSKNSLYVENLRNVNSFTTETGQDVHGGSFFVWTRWNIRALLSDVKFLILKKKESKKKKNWNSFNRVPGNPETLAS